MDIDKLKFPIGRFEKPEEIEQHHIDRWIQEIALFPVRLNHRLNEISGSQLEWKYRPDGWTIKQVVHHCADSHMNAFIRFKLSLTEELPTIKPYFEGKWANLPDTLNASITTSLKIIEGLHARWNILLKSMNSREMAFEFVHPQHDKKISLKENTGLYAWHCNHHLAHIALACKAKGEFNQ